MCRKCLQYFSLKVPEKWGWWHTIAWQSAEKYASIKTQLHKQTIYTVLWSTTHLLPVELSDYRPAVRHRLNIAPEEERYRRGEEWTAKNTGHINRVSRDLRQKSKWKWKNNLHWMMGNPAPKHTKPARMWLDFKNKQITSTWVHLRLSMSHAQHMCEHYVYLLLNGSYHYTEYIEWIILMGGST